MTGFILAVALGIIAFTLTWNAIHKPHRYRPRNKPWRPKRRPTPTIEDVWATIHSAQYTVDHSYDVIYGRKELR